AAQGRPPQGRQGQEVVGFPIVLLASGDGPAAPQRGPSVFHALFASASGPFSLDHVAPAPSLWGSPAAVSPSLISQGSPMLRKGLLRACLIFPLPAAAGAADAPGRGLNIYFIDVEGGAATLIVTPAGESVLIDCGFPGSRDAERIHKTATQVAGVQAIDHLI